MPQTVIFLEDLGLGEKGIAEMLGSSIDKEADLVLFNSKYCLGLLWFYGAHRSLDGRPWDLFLCGRLWPQFPWELRTACLSMISLADG
jgi:hypothetical protein